MKRIICTAAYNDAGAFFRNLLDCIKLRKKYFMADGHIHKGRCIIAEGIGVHDQIIEEGVSRPLIVVFNHLLTKAAFLCRPSQKLLV